jgi:hypothetical protein
MNNVNLAPARFGLAMLLAGLISSPVAAAERYRVSVAAGDIAREQSLTTFRLPVAGAHWSLRDGAGRDIPLQTREGDGTFVLSRLAAGASASFVLERAASPAPADTAVRLERADGIIHARTAGRTILGFQEDVSTPRDPAIPAYYRRGGYLHPVFSPAGTLVTGDYPPDHFHHHGIWFAWVKTEYEGRTPDFWNVQDKLGRLDFKGVEAVWSGPVHGGLQARFHSIDILAPTPKPVVDDLWEVRIYAVGQGPRPYHVFDLISTQHIIGRSTLKLPEYRYGGIGIRGHEQWIGTGDKTRFLTSTGERDRIKAHESRAVWCHMGGLVDGKLTGIATLSHPANFRSPEPMRVNPKIPFLNFAPSQAGDWEMVPGRSYVWRYRFIVHDGEPDQSWLDARWRDYANPPVVTVERTTS